jgi:aminoglycoside phosphotransferase (APT) family kinase protein
MHPDEVDVTEPLVRRLLETQAPEFATLPLTRVPAWGTDHVIFRLGDDLAVRLPKVGWAAGQGRLEQKWLPRVASRVPVDVAVPIVVGAPEHGFPHPWYVVPWLDGDAVDPDAVDLTSLAVDLAGFVRALETVDPTGAPVARDGSRGGPLAAADAETRAAAEQLRSDPEVDVDALLAVWRAGVEAPPWRGPGVLVHGDLMDGNLLLRDGRLAGVIDWGGLRAGDPAVELMIAWSLFDDDARRRYREGLGFVDDAMWLRGRAWATSAALQALPYYRDTNPDIVARSKRAVRAVLADARSRER